MIGALVSAAMRRARVAAGVALARAGARLAGGALEIEQRAPEPMTSPIDTTCDVPLGPTVAMTPEAESMMVGVASSTNADAAPPGRSRRGSIRDRINSSR